MEINNEPVNCIETDLEKIRSPRLLGHVGFDSLPDQLVSKSVSQGFCFNILCIGETGIGKSTLMDSLFNTTFDSSQNSHDLPGVKLKGKMYELQESSVHLKLTIVETAGYGDQINKEASFKPIVDYIDAQFEAYLQEELKIKRSLITFHDTRIHACLYFISPTGHGLKSIDLICMKKLDSKVNIIPIIAKADCISKNELQKFKIKVMSEFVNNGIQIYQFPTDDETVAEINTSMNAHIPLAVVGSAEFIRVGNKRVRGRQYPWGIVEVENENHSDFKKLREMLVITNMEDLREQTHLQHYELYRRLRLEHLGFSDHSCENKPVSFQEIYEQKQKEHRKELQCKEMAMRQALLERAKEKETELKDIQRDLQIKFELLKKQRIDEERKLDDERKKLEREIDDFNRRKAVIQNAKNESIPVGKSKKR